MKAWYFTHRRHPSLMFRVLEPTANGALERLKKDDHLWHSGDVLLHIDLTEDHDEFQYRPKFPFDGYQSDLAAARMKKLDARANGNHMVLMSTPQQEAA